MFFCPELLRKKGHPFFFVWIAATQQGSTLKKYLTTRKVVIFHLDTAQAANYLDSREDILHVIVANYPAGIPKPSAGKLKNFSLYLSAKLMYGSCVVLRKQAALLFSDLSVMFKNLNELRWSEEKQAIVRFVPRKSRPTDEKSQTIPKGTKHAKPDPEEEAQLDFDFELALEISLIDDEEPLIFPNSVPQSAITMYEPPLLRVDQNEDLRFGDEGTGLLAVGDGTLFDWDQVPTIPEQREILPDPKSTAVDQEQVVVAEALSYEIDATAGQQAEPQRSPLHEILPDPKSTAVDQEQGVVAEALSNEIDATAGQQADPQRSPSHEILPDPKSTEVDQEQGVVAEALSNEIDATAGQQAEPQRSPSHEILPDPKSTAVDQEQGVVAEALSNEIDATAAAIHPQSGTDDAHLGARQTDQPEERCDVLELSSIIEKPVRARRKKRSRLIIDQITKIPSTVMQNRMQYQSKDTLRPQSSYQDSLAMYLKAKYINLDVMKNPCRGGSMNFGFKKWFNRHLITRPAPTTDRELDASNVMVDLLHHEPSERGPVGSIQTTINQSTPGFHTYSQDDATPIVLEGIEGGLPLLDLSRIPLMVEEVLHSPPSSKRARLQSTDDQPAVTVPTHEEINLDHYPEPLMTTEEQIMVVADETGYPEPLMMTEEQIMVVADETEEAKKRRPTKRPAPSEDNEDNIRKKHKKHPSKTPKQPPKVPGLRDVLEPVVVLPEPLQTEEQVDTSKIAGEAEVGIEQEISAQVADDVLEAKADLPPSSPPISHNAVLAKVQSLADDMHVNTVSMDELCPPSRTRRFKAAEAFYSLLELHKDNKVTLHQDTDDNTYGPLLITLKGGELDL